MAAAAHNGNAFFFGGYAVSDNEASFTSRVVEYKSLEDVWVKHRSLPVATVSAAATSVETGTDGSAPKIAVLGGTQLTGTIFFTNEVTSSVWLFAGGFWGQLASLPNARTQLAAVTIGNSVYAIGGYSRKPTALPVCEKYSIDADQWTLVAAMPHAVWGMAAVAVGHSLVAFGGRRGNAVVADCQKYDSVIDTWSNVLPMPEARASLGAAAVRASLEIVYAVGGETSASPGLASASLLSYTMESDEWTVLSQMPTPRTSLAVLTLSEFSFVAFGGWYDGSLPLGYDRTYYSSKSEKYLTGATASPTPSPTSSPTPAPSLSPTTSPTATPTVSPTPTPTHSPTPSPTQSPTHSPTLAPPPTPALPPHTSSPTSQPLSPSASPQPTSNTPSSSPTPVTGYPPSPSPSPRPTSPSSPTPLPTSHSAISSTSPRPGPPPAGPPAVVCTAGSIQACACFGAATGVQVCADDHQRWDLCACSGDNQVLSRGASSSSATATLAVAAVAVAVVVVAVAVLTVVVWNKRAVCDTRGTREGGEQVELVSINHYEHPPPSAPPAPAALRHFL